MMLGKAGFFLLLTFLLAVPPVFCQLEEEVSVNLIEIWAKVTDNNNRIVDDLKPEDFSVYIDGQKMDVRCFDRTFESRVSSSQQTGQQADETSESSHLKRKFVFFFDLLHSSSRDLDFLKRKIGSFLQTSFRDDDEGMVFALLPSLHLGVVQKMTANKEALISVVERMSGNPTLENRVRSNERELLDVLYLFGAAGSNAPGNRAGGASRSLETIRQARGLARSYASQEKNLSKITMNAFLTIAEYLNGNNYEGRLVMIYVSGGFSLRPGQNYYDMIDKAIADTSVVGTEDLAFQEHPDNDFENEVRNAIGWLNRLNLTIYSIDANGLVEDYKSPARDSQASQLGFGNVSYTQELQDSLAMISRETGGIAFLNSQNFVKGLEEVASDMNQQYWLCSSLPASKKHGTYHKIEVKVARNDVNVRYRKGYVD